VYFIFIFLYINVFSCFSCNYYIHGAWVFKELYDTWESGIEDELVVMSPVTVEGVTYVSFPHSIIIDSQSMQVPGAKWNILKVESLAAKKYRIHISSVNAQQYTGYIDITFIGENIIYFSDYGGDQNFIKSIQQTFLLTGEDNLYNRAEHN
jgi:predicted Rdx family selenoprotein